MRGGIAHGDALFARFIGPQLLVKAIFAAVQRIPALVSGDLDAFAIHVKGCAADPVGVAADGAAHVADIPACIILGAVLPKADLSGLSVFVKYLD